jgi:hypothetical protein
VFQGAYRRLGACKVLLIAKGVHFELFHASMKLGLEMPETLDDGCGITTTFFSRTEK